MTDERTPARDPGPDPKRPQNRYGDAAKHGSADKDPNPWTREGPDAPDAADIEDPDEQQ